MTDGGKTPTTPSGLPKVIAIILTLVLLAGTIVLLIWVFVGDVKDPLWARVMTLFNVIASLGYAGAGYLFGHQVQQVNVSEAQKNTAEAQQKVSEMKREASLALQTEFGGPRLRGADTISPAEPNLDGIRQRLQNILEK